MRPLPGAIDLLKRLTLLKVSWSIATSGYVESAGPTIEMLEVPDSVPIVTRDDAGSAGSWWRCR